MTASLSWFIIATTALVLNITSLFVALNRKYSLRFSVITLALFSASLSCLLIITRNTHGEGKGLLGFIYLPLNIFLFKDLLFRKIFGMLLFMFFTVSQALITASAVALFIPFGSSEYYLYCTCPTVTMYLIYGTLMLKFGRSLFDKLFNYGSQSIWALYSLGAVVSFATMLFINNTLSGASRLILLIFVLWSYSILCFAIINTHEKTKQKADAEFARNIICSGKEHYEKMNAMYDKLRILRHDYKYHFNVVRQMLDSGDTVSTNKYLIDIGERLFEYEIKKYCSNSVINSLIFSYAERCSESDIRLETNIVIPASLHIPDYDLCIIVGNLLENAVEACVKLEQDRVIEIVTKNSPNQLLIMIKNNFDGIVNQDDDTLISRKLNGGFGIRSVREVVSRHGGDLLTEWNQNTFIAYVAVNI